MSAPNLIFMGEKPLGLKCLRLLHEELNTRVSAVCTRSSGDLWWGEQDILPYCREQGIPVIPRKEIPDHVPDMLISVLYPFIVEAEYIRLASRGCFNLHEAPLPRWRGCNSYSHAILAGDAAYGTTLHDLSPELDAGCIVAKRMFPIVPGETAKELYGRTSCESFQLAREWFPRLLDGPVPLQEIDPREESFLNPRDSLVGVKRLTPGTGLADAVTVARALDFVPWEPAYIDYPDHRYYLFISDSLGRTGIPLPDARALAEPGVLGELPWGDFAVGVIDCGPRPLTICRADIYRSLYPLQGSTI